MRKELADKLAAQYSEMLRCPVNVGDGWYSIVRKLLSALRKESSKVRVINIEQEFGGLQVYINPRTTKLDKIVQQYEDKSWKVCEYCGSTKEVRRHSVSGRRTVLCGDCAHDHK